MISSFIRSYGNILFFLLCFLICEVSFYFLMQEYYAIYATGEPLKDILDKQEVFFLFSIALFFVSTLYNAWMLYKTWRSWRIRWIYLCASIAALSASLYNIVIYAMMLIYITGYIT